MKRILIALFLSAICVFANAQEKNKVYTVKINDLRYSIPEKEVTVGDVVVGVLEVIAGESTCDNNNQLAPSVSAMVRTAFSDVRRLAPVSDSENADFDIQGDITSIVTHTSSRIVERKDSKGVVKKQIVNSYEASIGVTLTLTEIATGQQWTNSFSSNTEWYDNPTNEFNAFEQAVNRLQSEIIHVYNGMFPLVANIVERGNAKKDRQKEVYIDLGAANGIGKGLHFDVFTLNLIAGHETREKIGRLKVESVKGDEISLCKVVNGAKEIKTALDQDKMLLVVSVEVYDLF